MSYDLILISICIIKIYKSYIFFMNNRKSKSNKPNKNTTASNIVVSQIIQSTPLTKIKSFNRTEFIIIVIGVIIRVGVILFISRWENIMKQELNGTDIDYKVYTDAAYYDSPYERHTYRYTPLLAYMMKFNHIFQCAGKLIFVLFDVLAMAALVYINRQKYKIGLLKLYAYNPLFIYLTARGSCQSISLALMFWAFYFIFQNNGNIIFNDILNQNNKIQDNRKYAWAGYSIYGLWVHFRVYPIILLPMILIHEHKLAQRAKTDFKRKFLEISLFAGGTFLVLFSIFYLLYGYEFLQQTYLYHISRLDNRHSLSPFFYEIYLGLNTQSFMRSIAQICIIIAVTKRIHQNLSPYYAHFLITYAFVSFNKVITMQYYMWIFGALILVLPESTLATNAHRRFEKSFSYIMQWILGVILWVWLSIRLQKTGQNVFNLMWLVCVIKLFTDLWSLIGFMDTIRNKQLYQKVPGEELTNQDIKTLPKTLKDKKGSL